MSCEFCEPYHQKLIEGENGFCAITKNGELIVYPKAKGVNSVKIKIKRCPMCGRDFVQQEKQYYTLVNIETGLIIGKETGIQCKFDTEENALEFQKWMGKDGENYKIELRTLDD